ncbi:hypothetical protein TPHA_0P01770 [Tetrapisispora phaffii CBS 4417]|uniref:Mediator of RNA polymerase II transcription subunit 16 n=1 Tax=Tetrapisispora phaffii (strain ATCC 24235 / CBS 4417 / NBRC 1672 / NRRL Y-8282 / UCD 70-5) TaxID=1071381 RepID=G8C2F6_TETPH|nr:hypothetical protein TPHA_0P01770 [Tetrapisispora phaffii CBS 4417]CCE66334.1 hypothetical protein TPHA_0P01770 [Tetrapisispora phaffii CBS 4417]
MIELGNQAVSWSKTGLIVYSDKTSTDSNLCMTFLETINGTTWRFHPPKKYTIHPHLYESQNTTSSSNSNGGKYSINAGRSGSPPNYQGSKANRTTNKNCPFFYEITSVHWNNWFNLPGDMLAVCDELGNLTILILGQSLQGPVTMDKLTMLFQDNIYKIHNNPMQLNETSEDSVKCVKKESKKEYPTRISELFWLSSSKPVISSQFCVLDSSINSYRNKVQQIPPYGVFHPPFMKYSCLAVRKNGQIDFWYQFSNSKSHKKISLHLNTAQGKSSNDMDWVEYTNISALNEDQSLLISTYSRLTKVVSFYKLHVNWNITDINNSQLNDPLLSLFHLSDVAVEQIDDEGNLLEFQYLYVISKAPVEKDSAPEILLLYNVLDTGKSIIKRYKLIPTQLNAHYLKILKPDISRLDEQKLKPKHRYTLNCMPEIHLDKKVINIISNILDGFVSIHFEDSTIETYSKTDWKVETERLHHQNRQGKFRDILTSVLSAGFNYPKLPPQSTLEWAIVSPTMCGVLIKQSCKDIPQFISISHENTDDASLDKVNSTAFAFAFVASIHRQLSAEDLSIACKTHLIKISDKDQDRGKECITSLMADIYSFFNITPDAPPELLEKMISSRPVQKTMLLQLELGSSCRHKNVYEMARIIMNLRNVYFAFNGVTRNLQFAIEQLNTISPAQLAGGKLFQTSFTKQDLIHSLIPIAKWLIKFITYLIQEVLILINKGYSSASVSSLVYGVFGARIPRSLLLSILNEIKRVIHLVTKFPENNYPVLNESSKFLKKILSESTVNIEKFETFLVDVNTKFMNLNSKNQSTTREPSLLVKAEIPEDISKISSFLLTYSKNAIISHIDPAQVYFADTSGLRISKDEIFQSSLLHLSQPLDKGLVTDTKSLGPSHQTSRSFSKIEYDGVSYDTFTDNEMTNGSLKRCCRCGCVTRAGYTISEDKTIISTSIKTRRWPTMYARVCICSGYLYELEKAHPEKKESK